MTEILTTQRIERARGAAMARRHAEAVAWDTVLICDALLAHRTKEAESAPAWIAFESQRPEDRQEVFLAWRWKNRPDEWEYAHAIFCDDGDGYYWAHVSKPEEWVLEEDLDDAVFFWQIPGTPIVKSGDAAL